MSKGECRDEELATLKVLYFTLLYNLKYKEYKAVMAAPLPNPFKSL